MIVKLDSQADYHKLLSYPDQDKLFQRACLKQLQCLGVDCLLAEGLAQLAGYPLLGVGYCGLVFAGIRQRLPVAIKVRRRSCQQPNLDEEARLLKRANLLGIGPRLCCQHGDFLIMERLSGCCFGEWLQGLPADAASRLQSVLQQLLWQAFALDRAGIDHGALRCVCEHAFIDDDRVTLLDFSHSSDQRRPNNVTSLVAGLLWGTRLAPAIRSLLVLPDRDSLLPCLRSYKQHFSRCRFRQLLQTIGLDAGEPHDTAHYR